jgi:hypothetical protein
MYYGVPSSVAIYISLKTTPNLERVSLSTLIYSPQLGSVAEYCSKIVNKSQLDQDMVQC